MEITHGVSKREYVTAMPLRSTKSCDGRNAQTPFTMGGRWPLPLVSVPSAQSSQS